VRGVSQGQYYNDHLAHIVLNQQFVPFTNMDLTYLHKVPRRFNRDPYAFSPS